MLKNKKNIFILILIIMTVSGIAVHCYRSKKNKSIELTIVGDIMLSRGVDSYIKKRGYDHLYENMKDIFLEDDLTIVNLECPITEYSRGANKASRFVFKASADNAKAMKKAGIDLCDLANNHTMDYRSEGLKDTMDELVRAGISYVGAGENAGEDMSYIFEKDGFRLGILAYSIFPPEGFVFNADKANINYLLDYDGNKSDKIKTELENMKADFKIVYFHWGIEYERFASNMQKNLARYAIDNGADFVVGAHPHVIQESEVYKDKYIYYSLGNCIFDKQIQRGTDEGLMLRISIDKKNNVNIEERKFKINKGQPVMME